MPKLKIVSGKKIITFLMKEGYVQSRQVGSHVVLVKKDNTIVVPLHKGKDLGRGLIASILRDTGITRKEYENKV